ncbi:hypothetical protein B6I21_07820 [candidate division KSB1 bacterium 4572_119]|nr:MAG: hypothetical protein B6I21_07820 [candidate division KSB1 bacterium 4572_119]
MSDNETFKGYRGAALDALKNFGVRVWSDVDVQTTRGEFKGIILPRSETADDLHVVLKLRNGYNVGLAADTITEMRSSDRPSSDAAINLINATKTAAESDIAEVVVCMFGPTSDQYDLLHRGTRVRKMHSSYRSTFRTIGDIPLAMVGKDGFNYFRDDYKKRRNDKNVKINTAFEEKVTIVYYYPNMQPDIIDALADNGYKGIVIAGTGLGHVNKPLYPALKRAQEKGIAMYMTVQTLWGYVQMYVYDTGRDIMELGVIPAANMLPEVSYMKLGWALGQTSDLNKVKDIMLTPIAGEITEREPHNGYLVYQGGIPEVEEFITKYWK